MLSALGFQSRLAMAENRFIDFNLKLYLPGCFRFHQITYQSLMICLPTDCWIQLFTQPSPQPCGWPCLPSPSPCKKRLGIVTAPVWVPAPKGWRGDFPWSMAFPAPPGMMAIAPAMLVAPCSNAMSFIPIPPLVCGVAGPGVMWVLLVHWQMCSQRRLGQAHSTIHIRHAAQLFPTMTPHAHGSRMFHLKRRLQPSLWPKKLVTCSPNLQLSTWRLPAQWIARRFDMAQNDWSLKWGLVSHSGHPRKEKQTSKTPLFYSIIIVIIIIIYIY